MQKLGSLTPGPLEQSSNKVFCGIHHAAGACNCGGKLP